MVLGWSLPASASPSCIDKAGTQSAPSAATATTSAAHGRACTRSAQLRQRRPGSPFCLAACLRIRFSSLLPKIVSSEGSSTSEATIVISTVSVTESATPSSEPRLSV